MRLWEEPFGSLSWKDLLGPGARRTGIDPRPVGASIDLLRNGALRSGGGRPWLDPFGSLS